MVNRPTHNARCCFTRRQIVAGLTVLPGALLLACNTSESTPTATPATTPASAGQAAAQPTSMPSPTAAPASVATATAVPRRELRIGVQGLPPNLDPHQQLSNVGTRVTYSIFDYLIRRDFLSGPQPGTGFALVPWVAKEWKRIDDLTVEFTLRDDVTFHDGSMLTAEDVVFTFERLLKNTPDQLREAANYFKTVAEISALDRNRVRFVTQSPDPVFEKRISSWGGWLIPKAYYERVGMDGFARAPVGTGPYRVAEFVTDERLVLEPHETYFGGRPTASRIVFQVIPEIQARVAALLSGEVDLITNVPPDQVPVLQRSQGIVIRSIPLANCHVLRYNGNHPLLKDKRLRQALNLGIDRELLIKTLWNGQAVRMRSHQFEDYGPLYNAQRPYTPYDPDRARQLVRQSGYDGSAIRYNNKPGYYTLGNEAAQAIVEMWRQIGVNAEVQLIDWADLPKEERMVGSWSNSNYLADPEGAFWLRWGPGTATQRDWWKPENPRFNELGEQQRQTLDQQFRARAFQDALDIWEEEAPGTVLWIPIEHYAMRDFVKWTPYSFYYMDLRPDNLSFAG